MVPLRKIVTAALGAVFLLACPNAAAYAVVTAPETRPSEPALAKGYTYWGYFTWNDKTDAWDYMQVGANDTKQLPADGDVYGFRWALVVKEPRLPRADGDFDAICGSEQRGDSEKRVAFVLDYGSKADAEEGDQVPAPRGVCAVADDKFTVQQALQTVAAVRTGNGGLICGIDDYPSKGCGDVLADVQEPPADEQVTLALPGAETTPPDGASASPASDGSSATTEADTAEDGSGSTTTLIVAVAAVVVLAAGAVALRRRKS
ncbi:MAG: hypothetical protein H0U36_04245 [Nocardioidaceae bacterium]|nr:hypothetical protein [Nocardioidaceae bacterium]